MRKILSFVMLAVVCTGFASKNDGEKKDSCKTKTPCVCCKDIKKEKKLAKVKGAGQKLPLPLDSICCDSCVKNGPSKGLQRVSQSM